MKTTNYTLRQTDLSDEFRDLVSSISRRGRFQTCDFRKNLEKKTRPEKCKETMLKKIRNYIQNTTFYRWKFIARSLINLISLTL